MLVGGIFFTIDFERWRVKITHEPKLFVSVEKIYALRIHNVYK